MCVGIVCDIVCGDILSECVVNDGGVECVE